MAIIEQYRLKLEETIRDRLEAQTRADRFLKRLEELTNRDRKNRRRIEHLTRSLAFCASKRLAQTRTLYEKDRKAIQRNEELRVLNEFRETIEAAFPDIEENIRTIQESLGDIDTGDTASIPPGNNLE